jgi:hypothetical protein
MAHQFGHPRKLDEEEDWRSFGGSAMEPGVQYSGLQKQL